MALYETFAVYDQKAQAYLPPFILPNVGMAQRIFNDCVNSKDHQFSAHPEDYTLFQLGTFDDNSGLFDLQPHGPRPIGNGLEYLKSATLASVMDDTEATEGRINGKDKSEAQDDSSA